MLADPFSIPPGTVLAGKYRVERVLGAGGMGFVVAATHLELQQLVAVKFLHGSMLANSEAVARFVREARAAARIRSEHVARVIDVGRLEDGAPFTVMEFLQGQDLAALLERGRLPVDAAVEYVLQACHAVAEAHGAGIVHRDLKPSNLFLTERADGVAIVKVLDFGISKLTATEPFEPQLTSTQSMMGSPLYMSPEQMRSFKDVDHRTDIWALGVILYELMSGAPPFGGNSLHELVTALVTSTPASLHAAYPEISPELERVVLRCLEKDPALRFQSIGELARELLPFAPQQSHFMVERVARLSGSSRPPDAHGSQPAPSALDTGETGSGGAAKSGIGAGTGAPWASTRGALSPAVKRPLILAAVAVVVALAAGLALALRKSDTPVAPSALPGSAASPTPATPLPEAKPAVTATPPRPAVSPELSAAPSAPSTSPNQTNAPRDPAKRAAVPAPARSAAVPTSNPTATGAPTAASAAASSGRRRTLDIDLK